MTSSAILCHVSCWQAEMKCQKDELQRQRDTLQRQIDLFEAQRRHWLSTADHRTSPPTGHPDLPRPSISASTYPSPDDTAELSRVRNADCGSQSSVRQLSPMGRRHVAGDRVLSRVGSAGSVATLDGRTVPRVNSTGSLTLRRDNKPLPIQLMSTTNDARITSCLLYTSPSPRD